MESILRYIQKHVLQNVIRVRSSWVAILVFVVQVAISKSDGGQGDGVVVAIA